MEAKRSCSTENAVNLNRAIMWASLNFIVDISMEMP